MRSRDFMSPRVVTWSVCLLAVVLSGTAGAQTLTGTLISGSSQLFEFTMPESGQARFTVTWEDAPDIVGLIVGCEDGEGGVMVFGTSISDQDRIVSLDVGILSGADCAAVVQIISGAVTDFAINLQVTSPDGFVLDTALQHVGGQATRDPKLERLAEELASRAAALRRHLR